MAKLCSVKIIDPNNQSLKELKKFPKSIKMKKPCKECPHFIRNRHNDMIVEFGKRTGKKHNCHMTEGVKDLWNVTDKKLECYGSITFCV